MKLISQADLGAVQPKYKTEMNEILDDGRVPDEFFRRYTHTTDSRPLTPTPSCATSAKTRTGLGSSHLSTRRCVTPDPVSNNDNIERKQIILDLRRSHSQEILYWNTSTEMHQDSMSSSWLQSQSVKHEIEIIGVIQKEEIEDILEMEEEEGEHIPDYDLINETEDLIDPTASCINARDGDDDEFLSRRGKLRRKKSKTNVQVITFQPSNEPETQVAALPSEEHDPDSPNLSARSSLIPEGTSSATPRITPLLSKSVRTSLFESADKSFFLDENALKTLRMGLSVEIVECVFDKIRHRTLQEVLRTISPEKMGVDSDAVLEMKDNLQFVDTDYEKWMHLPRKFSRSSARFELPMDLRELFKLKAFDYLSKYVFVEPDKKQLYHRIFVKYLPKDKINREENDNEEFFARVNSGKPGAREDLLMQIRTLQYDDLKEAMKEVLGFHATDEKIQEVLNYLELEDIDIENLHINFRTFTGIVAFSERLLTTLDQNDDPRNEIEIADFETLARHFDRIESVNMKNVFNIIQK